MEPKVDVLGSGHHALFFGLDEIPDVKLGEFYLETGIGHSVCLRLSAVQPSQPVDRVVEFGQFAARLVCLGVLGRGHLNLSVAYCY